MTEKKHLANFKKIRWFKLWSWSWCYPTTSHFFFRPLCFNDIFSIGKPITSESALSKRLAQPAQSDNVAVTAWPRAIERMGKERDVPQWNFLRDAVSTVKCWNLQREAAALTFGGVIGSGNTSRSWKQAERETGRRQTWTPFCLSTASDNYVGWSSQTYPPSLPPALILCPAYIVCPTVACQFFAYLFLSLFSPCLFSHPFPLKKYFAAYN